jgi:DNA-binding transcriptional ArsR family regulator
MGNHTFEELSMDALAEAAECLKTLGHPHRIRMVQMMLRGEHTVGELAEACEIPSHMASEHLGRMKDRGLLSVERRGRRVFYSVAESSLSSIIECMEARFASTTGRRR